MRLVPLTTFRYFTERELYLEWLGSAECQRARRAMEGPIEKLLAKGATLEIYCAAHAGHGRIGARVEQAEGAWNWRESGQCLACGAITRIRLVAEWIERARTNYIHPQLYITEQLTPLFKALSVSMPGIVGSEFVPNPDERARASATLAAYLSNPLASVRHEDVTALSFEDGGFDLIGSFDVLEHVPDYARALCEFYRVLRPGGQLMLTVPFLNAAQETLVRARHADGALEFLESPEYHGNPTIPGEGVLCYYHFGWDLLDQLRRVGFRSVALLDAWGYETGIFGDLSAIVATK